MQVTRSIAGWKVLLACAGVLATLLPAAVRADKGANDGAFRDASGKEHAWNLERSHILTWDGQPYTPAGLVFYSQHLKQPSAETLQQDQQELDRLKAAGVQDLWIDPQRGLLESTPEQVQAVLDAVESRGFRYGLRIGDRSREPLIGFSPTLAPEPVMREELRPGGRVVRRLRPEGGRRVVYNLVGTSEDFRTHKWTLAGGEAVVAGDAAQVEIQLKPRSSLLGKGPGLLLAVPEVQVEPEDLGSFGDLWEGMETYAARLARHLKALRFGPGFRFLLDPIAAGDGTIGQEDAIFPTSRVFRNGFKEYLQRRGGVSTLNIRWRTTDRQILTIEHAARIIPMWSRNDPPDGDGWLFDPEDKVAYRCIPKNSHIWEDLENFRAEWLRRWMNNIAISLKQDAVNAPVLFSWASYHPLFNNSPAPSGYDGLGAQVYGAPETVARTSAAFALAQVEEADRNTWLIATRLAGPVNERGEPTALRGADDLRKSWQAIREAGFRGCYLDPRQIPDAASLVRALAAQVSADRTAMAEKVPVMFFPMPLATADRLARLQSGVWWLPSGMPARLLRYGDGIMGYQIDRPFGEEHVVRDAVVMWSTDGERDATFYYDGITPVYIYDNTGKELKLKIKKGQIKLNLSEEPLVATGLDATALFPLELAITHLQEFDDLLRAAETLKLDTKSMRFLYEEAKRSVAPSSAGAVYNSILPYLVTLRQAVSPFVWLEGEHTAGHNMNGVAFQAGCSTGTYLKLDKKKAPPSGSYRVRYLFDIRRDATYEIWVAGKVPGRPGISPLAWQIDEEPEAQVNSATPHGPDYTPGMAWYSLGKATLKAGRHALNLRVPESPSAMEGKYTGGIDVIMLTRDGSKPQGIDKPYGKLRAAR